MVVRIMGGASVGFGDHCFSIAGADRRCLSWIMGAMASVGIEGNQSGALIQIIDSCDLSNRFPRYESIKESMLSGDRVARANDQVQTIKLRVPTSTEGLSKP